MLSIEVVCSPKEERAILDHLLSSGDVVPLAPIPANPKKLPIVDLDLLPPWPEEAVLWFWCRDAGPLRWLRKPPIRLDLGTQESFKTRLLQQARWHIESPARGAALIDLAKSPILAYARFHEWRAMGPVTLDFTAPRGTAGALWGRRMVSWIEKQSVRLQDMKKRCRLIVVPEPEDESAATVVAFPEGMKLLRKGRFYWDSDGVKPVEKRPRKEKAAPAPKPPPPSRECVHAEALPESRKQTWLSLWWVFPPSGIRNAARQFLAIAAEKFPAMLSARFNNYAGLSGTLRSRPDRFESAWRTAATDVDPNLSLHGSPFSATFRLMSEELEGRQQAVPFVLLDVNVEATALDTQPALLKELDDFFSAVAERLGATYGAVQLMEYGRKPIDTRGTWTGIPRVHPWRTWFGGPYPKLVEKSLQGFEVRRAPGGLLLRMAGPPAPDLEWCGRYPELPDRLLARGTYHYLEPAPFIPRLGK